MKNKIKVHGRFCAFMLMGILLCVICLNRISLTARAEKNNFIISANTRQTDKSTYDVQLTLENLGEDWEGIVRLLLHDTYAEDGDAYDTMIALPQGSTKQFVVKVPLESVPSSKAGKIILLDKKGNVAAEQDFPQVFRMEGEYVSLGILSDTYADLTYLDMGGIELGYVLAGNDYASYSVKLIQLDENNLAEMLDDLNLLVIDNYNTSILSDDMLSGISRWVDAGGVLIVGTGSYAENTLSGLDYLGVECVTVHAPRQSTTYGGGGLINETQLSIAELTDSTQNYAEDYTTRCLTSRQGDGAVGILPYSMVEIGNLGSAAYNDSFYSREDFAYALLNNVSDEAYSRYNSNSYSYDYGSVGNYLRTMLDHLGNGATRLQYGGLKFIVILYVILAGPVLYLVLRTLKKQDFYWAAVPAAALVGVLLVYFAGRGFEVASTRVFSVTVENPGSTEKVRTYFHCYDAGHKEWDVQLAEGYEYAGFLSDNYYHYTTAEEEYYYRIQKEGDRLSMGLNPASGFEDSYFLADRAGSADGAGISLDIQSGLWKPYGQIVNGTDSDFAYFMIIVKGNLYLYEDLAAGEECMVEDKEVIYSNLSGNIVRGYNNGWLPSLAETEQKNDYDILTALGIGLCRAYPEENFNDVMMIGVTGDCGKTVDDRCNEVSYKCYYTIQ